jgi:hypothetical protein
MDSSLVKHLQEESLCRPILNIADPWVFDLVIKIALSVRKLYI